MDISRGRDLAQKWNDDRAVLGHHDSPTKRGDLAAENGFRILRNAYCHDITGLKLTQFNNTRPHRVLRVNRNAEAQ
jgi:hypothetical protein